MIWQSTASKGAGQTEPGKKGKRGDFKPGNTSRKKDKNWVLKPERRNKSKMAIPCG